MWVCSAKQKFREKQAFYKMKGEWDIHSTDDLVMCFVDFNEHVGGYVDGMV